MKISFKYLLTFQDFFVFKNSNLYALIVRKMMFFSS